MKSPCVEDDDLLRLVDGELTENEADRVRQHLRACGICRARLDDLEKTLDRIKMPVRAIDTASLIDDVMGRLSAADPAAPATRAPSRGPRWLLLSGVAAALASALVALPFVLRSTDVGSGAYYARGKAGPKSLAQMVGVSIVRVAGAPLPLRSGERVRPDDAFAVAYRNLGREPVYLLAFAVDAKSDVHWICPMYVDPGSDPSAMTLSPEMRNETYLPPPVQFESLAIGAMRFVAILSSRPMGVSSVEALQGAELEPAALRARWSEADVRELGHAIVGSSPEDP